MAALDRRTVSRSELESARTASGCVQPTAGAAENTVVI
jgi:hypothetical protein